MYAQTGSVSGVVKGANDAFLVGATVSVQGKKNAVTTDEQGKYSLSLPAGKYTIIISYTGYEEHTAIVTIKAGDASMYNATLVLTANNLTEITVGSRVRDSRGKLSTPVPVDVIRTKDIATLAQSDRGKLMKMVK